MSLCDLSDGSHTEISELLQRCTDFSIGQMAKNLLAVQDTCSARHLGQPLVDPRVQPLGQEDPLEQGMAIHSSLLAWRTP